MDIYDFKTPYNAMQLKFYSPLIMHPRIAIASYIMILIRKYTQAPSSLLN